MIVFAQRKPDCTQRVAGGIQFWYRCMLEDGSYHEDTPVLVTDFTLSEVLMDAQARADIATRFTSVLGRLQLTTDIKIR